MLAATRTTLSSLVEEHLTELISDAVSVQRHTKRVRTIPSNNVQQQTYEGGALVPQNTINNNTPTPIITNQEHQIKKILDAEDVNLALQLRGSEKIYAPNPSIPITSASTRTGNANDEIVDFVSEKKSSKGSKRVDLNAYVTSEMQSQPPFEVGLRFHW